MERKTRMLTVLVIIAALTIGLIFALPYAATRLFNRINSVENPSEAKARGRELLKESKVIVAVGGHPDDLEYYTGGTLGVLAAEGKTVIGVISADKSPIQETRRAEMRKAAEILGYKAVFLDHPDRGLTRTDRAEIREQIKEIIKKYNADTVIAYDYADQGPIYHHVDHIATGIEAQAAAREAGIDNVYLYFSADPNTSIDISGVLTKKSEAMAAHVSQHSKPYLVPLSWLFGWMRPAGSADTAGDRNTATGTAAADNHFFGNTEYFRKL